VKETVVVVAGGLRPSASVLGALPSGAVVVGADGGAEHALALGLRVELAVGDFDSITPAGLEALERAGVRIERHPAAKDATDVELALDAAMAFGPRRILLVGDAGGRLDHLLGVLFLLGADGYAAVEMDAILGPATVHVVRRERSLVGEAGELISLLALHGPAGGVVTEGLVYPLRGERLAPGSSRGLSNLFATPEVRVSVESGVVLVVRPGERAGA
jgi:thiamine pyrophosphokinase